MKIIVDNREIELYKLLQRGINGGESCTTTGGLLPSLFEFKEEDIVSVSSLASVKEIHDNNDLVKQKLDIGDIIIMDDDKTPLLIIERKTFADLLSSIRDGRYEEQSYRLRHSSGIDSHNIVYLIEGEILSCTKNKDLIYSAIVSLNCFKGFSVFRTKNIEETRDFLLAIFTKFKKERDMGTTFSTKTQTSVSQEAYQTVVKSVKKENITPENIGEIILCNIPGVNSVSAAAIMKNMSSIDMLLNELKTNPSFLEKIYTETNGKKRKLNKTLIKSIPVFLGINK
jgi:ERCC4-type nuclease